MYGIKYRLVARELVGSRGEEWSLNGGTNSIDVMGINDRS